MIYQSRRETNVEVQSEYEREYGPTSVGRWTWLLNLVYISLGLVTLVVGSRMFVAGAVSIAQALGLSDLVIGLTIVAAGTSLPELATSFVAQKVSRRRWNLKACILTIPPPGRMDSTLVDRYPWP